MNNFKLIPCFTFLLALFLLFSLSGWRRKMRGPLNSLNLLGRRDVRNAMRTSMSTFKQFNKKAHSFQSIIRLKKGLQEAELKNCFECHTTGYGKEGGFRSEQETPELKDAGCEVCHGPGSVHAETGDPKDIKGKLTAKDCEACHNSERIDAFKYKPLVYGGAH